MIGFVINKAPWEDWAVMLLPLAASILIVVWMLANRGKQSKRVLIIQRLSIGLLMSVFVIGMLLPSVSRVHRAYYKGQDQFHWVRQLRSADEATRLEAISALCNILKSPSSSSGLCRPWVIDRLAAHGPEAKVALPVLTELLKDYKDEDPYWFANVRRAIEQINSAAAVKIPSNFFSSVYPSIKRLGADVIWNANDRIRPGVNIELTGAHVTDQTLRQLVKHVKQWEAVETLNLGYACISDTGLECLAEPTNIKSLSLACTPVTDAGLKNLAKMPNLKMLWLTNTQVSDNGLEHLEKLQGLQVLFLGGTRITDAGLVHLQALPDLRLLWLCDLRISDSGIDNLTALTQLEDLNLASTPITDVGLMKLKQLKNLCKLNIFDTRVTESGMKELRRALPGVEIYH